MRTKGFLVLICGMLVFILIHALLSEFIFTQLFVGSVIPFLGGFSPSIAHDSVSTRNPAIEDFFAILSDLPGGYSIYFSPILFTPPEIFGGDVNGQSIPQWIDIRNPTTTTMTVIPTRQLIVTLLVGVLLLCSLFWIIKRSHYKRKQKKRAE